METGLATFNGQTAPTSIPMLDANGAQRALGVQAGGILDAPLSAGPTAQNVFINDTNNQSSWQITISGAGVISATQLVHYNGTYPIAILFVDANGTEQWTLTLTDLGGGVSILSLTDAGPITRAPQMMLRWSDNGGKTWSNTYQLSTGKLGEYNVRVQKRMLGRARKRVWEVSWTDSLPWRFNDAFVDVEEAVS